MPNDLTQAKRLIAECLETQNTYLDLGNCGITDLEDVPELFECVHLESLVLSSTWWNEEQRKWEHSTNSGSANLLRKLTEKISDLAVLQHLFLHNTLMSTEQIGAIAKLTSLRSLNIGYNQISDIRFLETLTQLKSLNLYGNPISDIQSLDKLTELQVLDISFNLASDISFIPELTQLRLLNLRSSKIIDFSYLLKLTELQSLDLSRSQISDFNFIAKLPKLRSIDLSYNQIADISYLKELTQLHSLKLRENQIVDINYLKELTRLHSLDLSFNQIRDISFLQKLVKLRSIDLQNNQISDISFLKELTQLQSLDLSANPVSDVSFLKALTQLHSLNLYAIEVSDFSPVQKLKQLRSLYLSSNEISDISLLRELPQLQYLDLSANEISDFSPIQKLRQLRSLYLRHNRISDVGFLRELTQLQSLDLAGNQISDIELLKQLTQLQSLDLRNNELEAIPSFLFERISLVSLEKHFIGGLLLYGNPLTSPPLEIVKQGRESILDWFTAKKRQLNEIKLILIGEPKAGKTSLLRRLKNDSFNENEVQTDGINIESIAFGDCFTFEDQQSLHELTGHFWDFGGQEIMNATHQLFLTNRSIYILVLDARKDTTVPSQIREWVKRIKITGGNSSIIVVANKIDINPGFGFENEYELQKEFPQIKAFITVSCKDASNLEFLKPKLEELIPKAELFNTEIDERWIKIKEQLQEETQSDHFLNQRRFQAICASHGLNDKQQQRNAINFLHDLGLVLHFDEIDLADYYVLDPYWITYGVYQIITSSRAGTKKGRVSMEDDLLFIVNEEEDKEQIYQPSEFKKIDYSPNEARFLVDVLNRFKLSFYLPNRNEFIIPNLLDTHEPQEITNPVRTAKDNIQFGYRYSYLPRTTMPNIMVETHQIGKVMWRTGCVLEHNGAQALISNYEDMITITVAGHHKQKREFMSVIRFIIDNINHKLQDRPDMLIPLPDESGYADYEELLERELDGETYYKIFKPQKKKFEISKLLDGISSPKVVLEVLDSKLDQVLTQNRRIIRKVNKNHALLIQQSLDNQQWQASILAAIGEVEQHQLEEVTAEVVQFVTTVFKEWDQEMDDKLQELYNDLKKSDHKELKLKFGIPLINLLGVDIGIESKFDIKGWMKQMNKKYGLKIFEWVGPWQR